MMHTTTEAPPLFVLEGEVLDEASAESQRSSAGKQRVGGQHAQDTCISLRTGTRTSCTPIQQHTRGPSE